MAIQWDKSLAVGVKLVDEQHQELFRMVNGLMEALLKGQSKVELENLLGFLGRYVVDHFGTEEKLMAQYRYPDAPKHKQQHADFVQTFLGVKAEFEKTGATATVSIAVNKVVCTWLREHIGGSDVALGKFLRTAGAKEAQVR
jgi:hemerythrin-like metal-binding protein